MQEILVLRDKRRVIGRLQSSDAQDRAAALESSSAPVTRADGIGIDQNIRVNEKKCRPARCPQIARMAGPCGAGCGRRSSRGDLLLPTRRSSHRRRQ